MIGKVTATEPLEKLVYSVRPDGIADVWLRKNMEEQDMESDKKGNMQKQYTADEVYFIIESTCLSGDEIESDFDYWYEKGSKLGHDKLANQYSLSAIRMAKLLEVSDDCEEIIYKGVDVTLSDGVHHFSLTEKDQLNLFGLQAKIASGATEIEYHSDGEPCRYFQVADIEKMVNQAMFHVSYHTTYCNSLNMWIKGAEKPSELEQVFYGADVPEIYQSEVLKDYLRLIGGKVDAE